MRLRSAYYVPRGRVEQIVFRLVARDLPEEAEVLVTDVQLQPGEQPTGVVPNPEESGTPTGKTTYRNGVVHGGQAVVLLANINAATPTRVAVERASGATQVASYRFGDLSGGRVVADGRSLSASSGWGRVPVVPERGDLPLPIRTDGRAFLRVEWTDRAEDDSDAPG